MPHFQCQQKVQFQHCDPAGIVFYPRYFEMINSVVESWFDEGLKVPFSILHMERGSAIPTATINTEFKAPSRLDDRLDMAMTILKLGGASLDLEIDAICGSETRFHCTLTLVHVKMMDGRPKAWPEDIRSKIEHLMKETSL